MSANLSTNFETAQADTLHFAAASVVPRLRLDWRIFLTLVVLAAWGGVSRAQAQATAQFSYAQSTVVSGLNTPDGVAVDGGGNVYIADSAAADVLRDTLQPDGTYQQSVILANAPSGPFGVAVDTSGNVYVLLRDSVQMLTPGSGGSYTQSTVASGSFDAFGLTVDASGNVYVTALNSTNHGEVLKAMPGAAGGAYTVQPIYTNPSGLTLYGVAVDGSGNVYVADGASDVLELMPGAGPFAYTESTLFNSQNVPNGVAVDGSGNLYITGYLAGSVLKETLQSGGTYTQSTLVSGLNNVDAVAVDASRNVYVAESPSASSGDVLKEAFAIGVNFHTVPVGSTSAAQTLTFTFTNSTAAPIKTPVVTTQGAAGLDFADTGNGTCTAASYSAPSTCTVDVTFTPTKTGTRYGAVNLVNSSGTVIATAYLYGTGQGPQVAFSPATQSTIDSGLTAPRGVAVDGNGNVYFTENPSGAGGEVFKATPGAGGVYAVQQIPTGTSPDTFYGVAVDGSGNVYVAYEGTSQVLKETLQPNGTYTQSTIGAGLGRAVGGVAVDGSGNVYVVGNFGTNDDRVLKETLQPDGTYVEGAITSGLNGAFGVAADASGNVYVAVMGTYNVVKETLQPNGTYTQSTVVTGLGLPTGVDVDGSGNLYISDYGAGSVLKETPQSGGTYTQSTLVSGLNEPIAAVVDGSGNLYIADYGAANVVKEGFADAPSLSFATTPVGTTSSDSPQTVTLENIGNAPLTLPPPASGENPRISTNFTLDSSVGCPVVDASSSPATLAADSSCTLPVDFTPQAAGSFSGTLAITDNNLNASSPTYAAQSVNLSGTATQGTSNTSVAASENPSYAGGAVAFTATVTSGGVVPTGTVTFLDGGTTLGTGTLDASGQATISTSSLTVGAHSITVVYSGDVNYTGSTSPALSQTVDPATFTMTIATPSASISAGQSASFPVTVAPEGTLSSPISFQCSAPNAAISCSVTPSSVTLGTTSTSVTLDVQASASVAAVPFAPGNPWNGPWNRWGWPLAALGLLPILGLGLLTKSRLIPKRVQRLAWASVLATGLALGLAACSSGASGTQAKQVTPAGSYTASITGTSGSQTVTKQVSVTVK